MIRIMVDLETMGNTNNSAIISIGAVKFDASRIHNTFYNIVDLESSLSIGTEVSASTILWWLSQNKDAQDQFKTKGKHIDEVLYLFSIFAENIDELWGNGSDFDNVILENAYIKSGRSIPWKFYQNRCYRTIKNIFPQLTIEREGIKHNALDDAIYQTKHLMYILNHIEGKPCNSED